MCRARHVTCRECSNVFAAAGPMSLKKSRCLSAGRAFRNSDDVIEEDPVDPIEPCHPTLTPSDTAVRRDINFHAWNEQRQLVVFDVGRLLDQVLARQIVAATF